MKKVLFPILGLVLALGLALPMATPAVAAGSMTVVSDNTTMVTAGNVPSATYPHNAAYAWEPFLADPNPPDPNNSTWDINLNHAFSPSADWIWESYRVVNTVAGDVVDFQKTFYVPGVPTSGTLYITCDNGYEVYVNGTFIGSAQLGAGWRGSNLTELYVYASSAGNDHWNTVENYDISTLLQAGGNTLTVAAANEYMGPMDNEPYGTISSNPAGLIFEIAIEYEVPEIVKTLVDSDPDLTPDTNGNDVDEVDLGTLYTFTMQITVTNDTGVTLTNVLVHDRLGAELFLEQYEVDGQVCINPSINPDVDGVTTWTRGKSAKWFIDWTIASLPDRGSETLTIVASLDQNPGGHQEYSSPDTYDLNSGATIVSAVIDEVVFKFDIQTDPIQVEVLPTD